MKSHAHVWRCPAPVISAPLDTNCAATSHMTTDWTPVKCHESQGEQHINQLTTSAEVQGKDGTAQLLACRPGLDDSSIKSLSCCQWEQTPRNIRLDNCLTRQPSSVGKVCAETPGKIFKVQENLPHNQVVCDLFVSELQINSSDSDFEEQHSIKTASGQVQLKLGLA